MPTIVFGNVATSYCLKNINFSIKDGEFLVLLGPSGAGKTTLLNVIAGLVPYSGNLFIDDKNVDALSPSERGVGLVFQDLYLFPHMTVFENVTFGLKVRHTPKNNIMYEVEKILGFLRISHLKNRYPTSLSGGEKQRVALARTLIVKPSIILMDEPLSSLDFSIAKHLRVELKRLQQKLNLTMVYVTHNFNEARELADRIAVIVDGTLKQVGSEWEIFTEPILDIQSLIPAPNILACEQVKFLGSGLAQVRCKDICLLILCEQKNIKQIYIMPYDIDISPFPHPGPDINRFMGEIIEVRETEALWHCKVKIDRNIINVETRNDSLKPNQKVWVKFNMRKIHIME
jgi:ABC-type sugar transport system ATPase subunit